MRKIVLATSNPHKLQEINAISNKFGVFFENVPTGFEPEETGNTFEENSYIKAFEAAKLTGKISLADDTGLCVEALNGAPGIYSARYAPTQEEKINKLLAEMKNIPRDKRDAYFVCTMVLVDPDGYIINKTQGKIDGIIDTEKRGKNGFGYDPVFFIPQLNRTMAELTEEEKNTISHRAKALLSMLEFLKVF